LSNKHNPDDTPAAQGSQQLSAKLWHYKLVFKRLPLKSLGFFLKKVFLGADLACFVKLRLERSDGKVIGIEVKASMSIKPDDFTGMSSFIDYSKEIFLHGILFYTGDKVLPFKVNNTICHAVPISMLLGTTT